MTELKLLVIDLDLYTTSFKLNHCFQWSSLICCFEFQMYVLVDTFIAATYPMRMLLKG